MAWHHIIPFSVLREVWNRLVDQHIESALPEARTAIRQYLMLCAPALPNADNLIDRIRAENTEQRRASHNPLERLSVPEAHQLATAAVWPAWNIVEGWRSRSDDPGDYYLDRFTAGLTPEAAARMSAIEILFGHFQVFAASPLPSGADRLRALAHVVSMVRPDLAGRPLIRYRAEMWVSDGAGLWRKAR